MSKTRWVVERTFGSIKRWFESCQGLLQRISLCTCPGFYGVLWLIICIVSLELL
ncbi:MAG: hypothetical protein ACMUEL_03170 [Flavobacteriales bacterium Tduv]